jgi:type II secretion system protein J
MKPTGPTRGGAFTLIELMMAMAIFALVLTAIYATWTLILKSSKLGLAAAAQVQRERISVRVIEDALISTRSFAADLQHYGFVAENGDEATLSFVARLPKSFPRSGKFGDFDVRRLTFSVESRLGSGRELVLRQNPILMDVDVDEKEHPLVLAKGVNKLRFEFWDVRLNDWVDDWTQTNQLPRLVRLTVQFAEPNQYGSYSQRKEEVTRIVALPSITVPANWQMQGVPGRPPPPP